MDFYDVLDQIVALLQLRGRVTYNALKLQFRLDDEQLAVLKDELLYAHPQVVDDAGRGLHWTGDTAATQALVPPAPRPTPQPVSQADSPLQDASPHKASPRPIRWRSVRQRTGWCRDIFAATTSAAPV
jgi:hypothetical protein